MGNIYNYARKYGNVTFKEKEFNDVDNLVFSLLSYLDFSNTNINKGKYSLEKIGREYLKKNTYWNISKLGIAQKNAYKLLTIVIEKERYRHLLLSNYVYNFDKEKQFSALTFEISKKLNYICFEGTDELVSGWKEDGELACFFPIPSHIEAINYVNNNVKLFGPNIIIGGHSKGGNLALVAAMFMHEYKKFKVKKVYNNDGPGLRKKEFESNKYKQIKKKYIHIVPDICLVGILLRHDKYEVIKSNIPNNILSHAISSWMIKDDHLVTSSLSKKSKRLEKRLLSWLDKHDDSERIMLINNIFKVFEDSDITNLVVMRKIKNIIKIIHNINNIDKQTKDLLMDLLIYNFLNIDNKPKKIKDSQNLA